MWGLFRFRHRAAAQDLVNEATGFLRGRATDAYQNGGRVPAWALVSSLAHSDFDHFLQVTQLGQRDHPASWNAAIAYLATEILATAPDARQLAAIQQEVLVPIELDLLAGIIPPPAVPLDLAGLIAGALDEYWIRHRA